MKGYTSDTIRNVALLGHGSSGKTTFLEAALLATGVVTRLGRVEDGNAVSDWDKMEIEKGYSINTSLVPVEYNKTKINFVDTPGFFDFVGEVESAVRAVEAALIVVDASSGIEVGTEKAWEICDKFDLPRMFFVTDMDVDNVSYHLHAPVFCAIVHNDYFISIFIKPLFENALYAGPDICLYVIYGNNDAQVHAFNTFSTIGAIS